MTSKNYTAIYVPKISKSENRFFFSLNQGGTFTDVYAILPDGTEKVAKLLSEVKLFKYNTKLFSSCIHRNFTAYSNGDGLSVERYFHEFKIIFKFSSYKCIYHRILQIMLTHQEKGYAGLLKR